MNAFNLRAARARFVASCIKCRRPMVMEGFGRSCKCLECGAKVIL